MKSYQERPLYTNNKEENNSVVQEDDTDEEEKGIPPLYVCVHRNAPTLCALWDQHPSHATAYVNVTPRTPCRFCGHTGTLRKAN